MKKNILNKIVQEWDTVDSNLAQFATIPPRVIMLEVTNACNLKCRMCHNPHARRKKGIMPVAIALKAIRKATDFGIPEVALYSTGEPLLYPHLKKLVLECKKLERFTYITTNGLLLDKTLAEDLCEAGLDSIKFSIDAGTPETYAFIKEKEGFDTVIDNIKTLRNIIDATGTDMKIICSMILMDLNNNDMEQFKKIFFPLADDLLITHPVNLGGKVIVKGVYPPEPCRNIHPCRMLWDRMVVCYNGNISACCVDFEEDMVYADLNTSDMISLWNNEKIMTWREMHIDGTLEDLPLCRCCDAPIIQTVDEMTKIQR